MGQLDFGDFLASIDLNQGNTNGSNAQLVPSQSWNVDLEGKKDLGVFGTTNLRLFYRRTEDYVALVPLVGGGEGTGNIPLVQRYGLDWNSTFKLDALGLPGAKIDTGLLLQQSRLDDPLTGLTRQLDYLTTGFAQVDFRYDIPGSDWAFGLHYEILHTEPYYRLGEIGRDYEGPVFDAFTIEHKDVFGLTVSAEAINLFDGRHRLYRTVYDGVRPNAPIRFIEDRDQLIGPIFRFSVKGSF